MRFLSGIRLMTNCALCVFECRNNFVVYYKFLQYLHIIISQKQLKIHLYILCQMVRKTMLFILLSKKSSLIISDSQKKNIFNANDNISTKPYKTQKRHDSYIICNHHAAKYRQAFLYAFTNL